MEDKCFKCGEKETKVFFYRGVYLCKECWDVEAETEAIEEDARW